MVVEDSKSTRKMEIRVIGALGFTNVVEAGDGQEAMNMLEAGERPDMIISDWNMPEKNGYELLVWVRAQPELKDTVFIIATGRGEKGNTIMAEEAGVSGMITKPFSPPELNEVIEQAFSQGDGPTSAAEHPPFVVKRAPDGKAVFDIGHIQITDHIILGVLKNFIAEGKLRPKHFTLNTCCETSWNPVLQKLERGEMGGAFILAPIAMDLFQFGTPIQLVLFAHKNGSICVRRNPSEAESGQPLKDFLQGKTFYIPHSLSIHHMLAHKFLTQLGLKPGMTRDNGNDVLFEVAAPVLMPEFVADPGAGGFIVAEPLGTKAISAGAAKLLFLTGSMWQKHPCCVVVLRRELIEACPEAVEEFVSMLLECGRFVEQRPDLAAFIGVEFLDPQGKLGLNPAILNNVLMEKAGIKTAELYPVASSLATIRDYMAQQMGINLQVDLQKFVNTTFADKAYAAMGIKPNTQVNTVIEDVSSRIANLGEEGAGKSNLQFEGRYLFFVLEGQEYGIHIMYVREIIKMRQLRTLPESPDYFKGVIDLRNKVIPIIDLHYKMNMGAAAYTSSTCIIVVEQRVGERTVEVGFIVDSVSEVSDVHGNEIESKPGMIASQAILAYTKSGGKLRTLLSVSQMLGEQGQAFLRGRSFQGQTNGQPAAV